jgi:hypothetical protein
MQPPLYSGIGTDIAETASYRIVIEAGKRAIP